ncbi:hypothetical protein KZ869_32655, partial [Pseudomonas aeruginosa]|nr:hypothetical protein [Pseudomonas aeruginosa]
MFLSQQVPRGRRVQALLRRSRSSSWLRFGSPSMSPRTCTARLPIQLPRATASGSGRPVSYTHL